MHYYFLVIKIGVGVRVRVRVPPREHEAVVGDSGVVAGAEGELPDFVGKQAFHQLREHHAGPVAMAKLPILPAPPCENGAVPWEW